jgi:hypothetical protein
MRSGKPFSPWVYFCFATGIAAGALGLFVLTTGSVVSAGSEAPSPASVCELVQHAEEYDGAVVQVRSRFESGGEHGVSLVDANCPQTNIHFIEADTNSDQSVDYLLEQIHRSDVASVGEKYPTVRATVIGTFLRKSSRFRTPEIRIAKAWNIAVRDTQPMYPAIVPQNPQ